jgi:hypothetical protein
MPATADFFVFVCRLAMRAAKFFVIYNSAFAAEMSAWSLFILFFFYHIQLLRKSRGTSMLFYLNESSYYKVYESRTDRSADSDLPVPRFALR